MQQRGHIAFYLVAILFLGFGSLYATQTPPWQAPDEPAHYNYVRQLADGRLPRMERGDYDQAYQSEVIGSRFDPQYSVESFEYEDYQPPLYYLLLTPSYWLSNGSLVALRLTSLVIGLGVVALAYATALQLFPTRRWLAVTVATFVAFLPQHLSILSSINNDALAELLIAAMLFVAVRAVRRQTFEQQQTLFTLALLLGLAFLTKVTAYLMAGVLGLYLLWRYWGDWRALWRIGVSLFVPALLIGLLWWGRNVAVYPGFDFLGTQAHDAVVVGQPTTAQWVADLGPIELLRRFWRTSFQSFYGQFGWMCCPLPGWAYLPLRLMTLLAVVGAAWHLWDFRPKLIRRHQLWLFSLLLSLNLLLYIVYNLRFVQHQGRYLFASLLPIALGFTIGLNRWLRLLRLDNQQTGYLLPLSLCAGFGALNLYVIRFILPCGLAFGGC